MNPSVTFHRLADGVLIFHAAFVAFVVFGLLLILAGGCCGWRWVRNPWFRCAHLAAIGIVVVQSWLGIECPLTTLETRLRERAGDATYAGAFIAHWLHAILFFEAPPWAFTLGYTLFGLAVAGSWILFRPRPFRSFF
jgi:hypothetical protein